VLYRRDIEGIQRRAADRAAREVHPAGRPRAPQPRRARRSTRAGPPRLTDPPRPSHDLAAATDRGRP
jgi:hypothetical protein